MAAVISVDQKTREEIVSYNPATGEKVGSVPNLNREEVFAAVGRARTAFKQWRETSFAERKRIVLAAREVILAQMDEIALLVSREMGKPVAEAFSTEIVPILDLMQYFARSTQKLLKPEKINIGQLAFLGRSSQIVYQPLGVVGVISPWNYPLAIPLGEVTMALMSGNTVVLKPSELTPLVGVKIGEIFEQAGLPKNVLQVVTGDGMTGAALVDAGLNKIMFTGSVATGKRIAAAAAEHLIPVVLELGGKDPMIVLEDANLETAARAAVWGAFANSGQTCASVERLYVHEKIAGQFIEKVVELTKKLRQNVGSDAATDVGSMVSESQLEMVESHVRDAEERGAKILTGGKRNANLSGAFYEPTVLTGVDHDFRAVREETFGPTLPIMTFKTDEEAVKMANDSEFGLTASVWTRDIRRGKRIAEKIEAGTVTINEVIFTHGIAQTPWGGVKNSGYGRTHGKIGLMELVTPQHIHVNRITNLPDVWWFNYSAEAIDLFRGFARYFAAGSLLQTARVAPQMFKRIRGFRQK